ncbi:MAG: hypothetical protein NVS9B7_28840 [Flavisolibacter sp.]
MKKLTFFLILLINAHCSWCQLDTAFILKIKSLDTANILKLDTIPVANDRLTRKIILLRKQRTGLTTETFINIKLEEEQAKDSSVPKEFYEKLKVNLFEGKGHYLIENSLINLYRRTYSEKEIDQLIRFYKTSAGKKSEKENFLLMVESIKDAEKIMEIARKSLLKEMKLEDRTKN